MKLGLLKRQLVAAAKAAKAAAEWNDPTRLMIAAQRRAVIEADRLKEVLAKTKTHRVTLVTNLKIAMSKAAEMDDESYVRGTISDAGRGSKIRSIACRR